MAENVLNLNRSDFNAAIRELADQGMDTSFLRQKYREQNSPFSGLLDYANRQQQRIEDAGRRPIMGGLLSKPVDATGMDAITQAEFEPAAFISGLLSGGAQAVDAPAAAMRGDLTRDEAEQAAIDVAGMAMLGSGLSAGRGVLDYDPSVMSAGLGWKDRLEQSTPKAWLDPKYDKPQWNPVSNVASSRPEAEMAAVQTQTGTLAPEVRLSLEDLQGKYLIPAYGDRTVAGANIGGVADLEYADKIRSLGGADFMRETGTGVWANDFKPARDLAATAQDVIEQGGDPMMVYTAMGPQSGDFSTMMMDSVLNQVDPAKIDPDVAARFDARAQKFVPKFEGILSPRLRENLLEDLSGTQRWNLWQELDRAAFRDAGLPDVGLARRAITDPRLLNATPFDSGLTVGRMTGGLLDSPDVSHPTYNTQIGGEYVGGIDPVAGAIMWRDFFENRRASGASTGSDQRSFLMNSPRMAQIVDQQMIDEAEAMREAVRGLNDQDSFLRLWRD